MANKTEEAVVTEEVVEAPVSDLETAKAELAEALDAMSVAMSAAPGKMQAAIEHAVHIERGAINILNGSEIAEDVESITKQVVKATKAL